MKKKTSRLVVFFLILIFIGGFAVRLYRFANPIADWHSWRQADTSAVSRNFLKHGFDVLHPRFDDLSNVASGKDNPNGYRFVEFPIYNIFQANFYKMIGVFTLEEWGRLVTILPRSCQCYLFIFWLKNMLMRRLDYWLLFSLLFFHIVFITVE